MKTLAEIDELDRNRILLIKAEEAAAVFLHRIGWESKLNLFKTESKCFSVWNHHDRPAMKDVPTWDAVKVSIEFEMGV